VKHSRSTLTTRNLLSETIKIKFIMNNRKVSYHLDTSWGTSVDTGFRPAGLPSRQGSDTKSPPRSVSSFQSYIIAKNSSPVVSEPILTMIQAKFKDRDSDYKLRGLPDFAIGSGIVNDFVNFDDPTQGRPNSPGRPSYNVPLFHTISPLDY